MEADIFNKEIIAVEFPAIVENDSKALSMLGGMDQISKILKNSGQRLHLSFRPENVFARTCCADAHPINALAIQVRQLRHKSTGEVKLSMSVIGVIKHVYKFESLYDFEYGPYNKVEDVDSLETSLQDNYQVFYNDIMPEKPLTSFNDYFKKDVPLYLPPMLFSRYDRPINYFFAPKFKTQLHISKEEKNKVITLDRKSRKSYTTFITMLDKTPDVPHPLCTKKIEDLSNEAKRVVKCVSELFDKRPIWTKNALIYHLDPQIPENLLKVVLPGVAYYMKNGPWARTWVRFGYDPRKGTDSKKYQIVDLRIIQKYPGEELPVNSKRKNFSLHNQLTRRNLSQQNWDQTILNEEDDSNNKTRSETTFRFKPGIIPEARQVCYQLCDIELPEVNEMCSTTAEEAKFDPIEGWCPTDYQHQVRYYLLRQINPLLERLPPKPPSSLLPNSTNDNQSKKSVDSVTIPKTRQDLACESSISQDLLEEVDEMDLDEADMESETSDEEEEEEDIEESREISLRPRETVAKTEPAYVDLDETGNFEEDLIDDSDEDPDFKPDD